MAQHDFTIDNQTFPATRSDINSALQALASLSSGASSPSTTFAYQLWVNTTADPNILNIRNSANNAWIQIGEVNQGSAAFILTAYAILQAGSAAAPSHSFDVDRDTGMYRAAANIIGFATNGTERFRVGDSGQLGVGGATYGTSGQVLTSGGSAAAPSWATPASSGQLIRAPQVLTGTSYTTPAGCSFIVVLAVGGGGGGGGGSRYTGSTNGGRGGGGGATFQATIPVSANTTYTIAIGAAGTGGAGRASSSGDGTVGVTGGTTSIIVGATTYAAGGGAGGAGGISNGGTQTGATGGVASPTASLLIYANGSMSTSGGTLAGGQGGNSVGVFSGIGGGNNIAANGFGAGGAGGAGGNNTNGSAGEAGVEGRLVVWEYS